MIVFFYLDLEVKVVAFIFISYELAIVSSCGGYGEDNHATKELDACTVHDEEEEVPRAATLLWRGRILIVSLPRQDLVTMEIFHGVRTSSTTRLYHITHNFELPVMSLSFYAPCLLHGRRN